MQNVRRIDDPGAPVDLADHLRRIHPALRGASSASLGMHEWLRAWHVLLDAGEVELANVLEEAVRENLPEPGPVSRRRV